MRNAILTSLLLASGASTSASRLECLHTRSRELATAAACGNQDSLDYCFSHLSLSAPAETLLQELERCFSSAGCTAVEAEIESFWVLRRCDAPQSDLRRARRGQEIPDRDRSLAVAREALPLAGITAMPARRQDTAATTTAAAATNNSPSPCFTDTTSTVTTCAIQTTGAESGKMSCFPTVLTSPVCREGLICRQDNQGNPSCMYKQSAPGVDGIVIAIVFASAIVISVLSICVLCCRERRQHRRIERAAEAARIAKEAKTQATVAAKRPGAAVTAQASSPVVEGQPLMYQTGPGIVQQQQQQAPAYGTPNPFADTHDGHPLR
ncbi:hypothetical protein VTK56DRAFT_786 [Thermocarpiscus australiensis]